MKKHHGKTTKNLNSQRLFLLKIQGESKSSKMAKHFKYKGVFGTIATMVRTEGPRSLYNGLVAGLQRQMSFASIRIGLYDSVKQFYTPKGSESKSVSSRSCVCATRGVMNENSAPSAWHKSTQAYHHGIC